MNQGKQFTCFVFLIFVAFVLFSCRSEDPEGKVDAGRPPVINPDYNDVTVPCNIAPLNFEIKENCASYIASVYSTAGDKIAERNSKGKVCFRLKEWKGMIEKNRGGEIKIQITGKQTDGRTIAFEPFRVKIAEDKIDPFICYRLLYPGYEAWLEMSIVQRSMENFRESPVFENQLLDNNCVNCHSFQKNDPDKFLIHVRGSKGGTYLVNGKDVVRANFQIKTRSANAVYPAWHPSGKFIAFSSNKTVQAFHTRPEKNIEVYDLYSSLLLYDVVKNEIINCSFKDSLQYMETFPAWSPDGLSLYYCRAPQVNEDFDFRDVRYDLVKMDFNQETRTFSKPEVVFQASSAGKSVSFPAVSPDGKYLVFTLHDYGTFSVWHKEADLYLLDLKTLKAERMDINSDETESYHSWSSDGRWIVFSSKRMDGLSARPYFAYFDRTGHTGKPFVLPQEDPAYYDRMLKTFNRPEFITGKIAADPRDFEKASKKEILKVVWKEE